MNYHCIWGKFSDDLLFIVILKFHFGTEKKKHLSFCFNHKTLLDPSDFQGNSVVHDPKTWEVKAGGL